MHADQEDRISFATVDEGFSMYVAAESWEAFYAYWQAAECPDIAAEMARYDQLAARTGLLGLAADTVEFTYRQGRIVIYVGMPGCTTYGDWVAARERIEARAA